MRATTTTTARSDAKGPSPVAGLAGGDGEMKLERRAALVGALSMACAPSPPHAAAPVAPPARYSGRLEDYVPAAGLRWLVRAAPAKLAESQSFRPALELWLSSERRQAFAATTGFKLESLPRGLIAGFDFGSLYLAELPHASAARARERFDQRQLRGASQRHPDPGVSVLSGVADGVPVGLVTIDDRVLAYCVGDLRLCSVVEAYARGRLRAKSAFQGAALHGLHQETEDAPVSAFVPGPFAERWHQAAGGLLAAATALTAQLVPTAAGRAALELTLHGDFSEPGAAELLQSTYMSVAGSSTGALLGLGAALDTRVNQTDDRVALRVPLPVTEVARGVRAATNADLDEIFRLFPSTREGSRPTLDPHSR